MTRPKYTPEERKRRRAEYMRRYNTTPKGRERLKEYRRRWRVKHGIQPRREMTFEERQHSKERKRKLTAERVRRWRARQARLKTCWSLSESTRTQRAE